MVGKMEREVHINWTQFLTSIAVSFIVAAGGATITVMATQASTNERLASLERRATAIDSTVGETNRKLNEINERLARIEGKLDAQK